MLSGEQVFSGLKCSVPGQVHQLHSHAGQDKLYLVLEGCGDVTVGELVAPARGASRCQFDTLPPHLIDLREMDLALLVHG